MQFITLSKALGACAVSALAMSCSAALAESCPTSPKAMPLSSLPGFGLQAQGLPDMSTADARMAEEMARIETAMRNGQITPYQAGKLARAQWELSQFQRGFMGQDQTATQPALPSLSPAASPGSCDRKQDLAAAMAPVVSVMAKEGMQTATSIMSALAQEVGRRLREEEQARHQTPLGQEPVR